MNRPLTTIRVVGPMTAAIVAAGILIGAAVVALQPTAVAHAATNFNQEINYQGRLMTPSNVSVTSGNYSVTFKLYTTATGGAPIWTEVDCFSPDNGVTCNGTGVDRRIPLVNGVFSVLLGSTTPLTGINFNQVLYLGVNIGGSSASSTWDGEMTPRKLIGAVPAALYAGTSTVATTLNGVSDTQFFRNDQQTATSSSGTFMSVLQSGAGKVAEFFGSAAASVLSLLSNGSVGIGSTTPSAVLSVQGSTSNATTKLLSIASSSGASFLTVLPSGNVGIGSSTPGSLLAVGGNAFFGGNVTATGTLTVAGATTLASSLNGILFATNGLVGTTSSSSLGIFNYFTNSGASTTLTTGSNLLAGLGTFGTIIATSTTGTSTFAGGLSVAGLNGLTVLQNGNVGISTGNPSNTSALFQIGSNSASSKSELDLTTNNNSLSQLTASVQGITGLFQTTTSGVSIGESIGSGTTTLGFLGASSGGAVDINFSTNGSHTGLHVTSNNGPDLMTVLANGNVGIGSTTPGSLLSVSGNGYFGGTLTAAATSTLTGLKLTNLSNTVLALDASGNVIATSSATLGTNFFSNSGATTSLTTGSNLLAGLGTFGTIIATSTTGTSTFANSATFGGSVGIGTVNPSALLNIAAIGTTPSSMILLTPVSNIDTTTILSGGSLGLQPLGNRSLNLYNGVSRSTSGTMVSIAGTGSSGGNMTLLLGNLTDSGIGTTSYLYNFQLSGVSRSVLTASGNLGIGSTTPGSLLSIQGSTTNATITLFTIASSSGASFLTVLPSGNVGIGSSTLGSLLSVSGNGFFGGNVTATGTLTVTATTTTGGLKVGSLSGLLFGTAGNVSTIATTSLGIPNYWTLSGSNLFNNAGTKVGINNSSPGYNLDLGASDTIGASGGNLSIVAGGGATSGVLNLIGSDSGGSADITIGNNDVQMTDAGTADELDFGVDGGSWFQGNGGLILSTNQNLTLQSSGGTSFNGGALFIDTAATNNVGIGTTTPGSLLTVAGNALVTGTTTTSGLKVGSLSGLLFGIAGNVSTIATTSLGIPNYWTLSGSNLFNNAGTNIGINNTSPSYSLDINNTFGGQAFRMQDSVLAAESQRVMMGNFADPGNGGLGGTGDNAFYSDVNNDGSAAVYLSTWGDNESKLYGVASMDASAVNIFAGNVGIGTNTPGSLLTVAGAANITGATTLASSLNGFLQATNGLVTSTTSPSITSLSGVLAIAHGGTNASSQATSGITFYNGTSITSSSTFVALANGNVGIGTSTPATALSVIGTTTTSGLSVGFLSGLLFGTNGVVGTTSTTTLGLASASALTALTASLSNGFAARWNGTTFVNSLLRDNGTVTGINATTSTSTFNIQGTSGINPFTIASSTGANLLTVLQNGNVGIGSSTPGSLLSVSGNGFFGGNVTATGTLTVTATTTTGGLKVGSLSGLLFGTAGNVSTIATSSLGIVTPPASPSGSIQFNNGGVFGGSSNATLDSSGNLSTNGDASFATGQFFIDGGTGDFTSPGGDVGGNIEIGSDCHFGTDEIDLCPDGSASFSSGAILLNPDGSAYFAGGITGGPSGNSYQFNTDGSGFFEGGVAWDGSGISAANSFRVNGGSSNQFLKADGSRDATAYLSGIVGIANGGTNASSQVTHGINFYNGTSITSSSTFVALANGNVGIGSSTPGSLLTVAGNALVTGTTTTGGLKVGSLSGLLFGTAGNVSTIATTSLGIPNYWTLSGSNLFNNAGTKVGINNSSPGYNLDLGASDTIGASGGNLSIVAGGGATSGVLNLIGSDSGGSADITIGNNDVQMTDAGTADELDFGVDGGSWFQGNGGLILSTNQNLTLQSSGGTSFNGGALFIDTAATNNVGIGTTTPGSRLTVAGNALVTATTTTGGLKVGSLSGLLFGTAGNVSTISTSSLGIVTPPAAPSGSIQFNNGGIFGGSSNATLDSSGNLSTNGDASFATGQFFIDGGTGNFTSPAGDIDGIVIGTECSLGIDVLDLCPDGSASFSSGAILLNPDGSAAFAGGITGGPSGNSYHFNTDGSGFFEGGISWDGSGNLSAGSFIVNGGSSNQFLKADGSRDATAYLSGIVGIANGGTATSSQVTHGINFYNGTSITSSSTFVALANGNVGIGTSTPNALFALAAVSGSTNQLFDIASSSGASYLHVTSAGNVGIGTSLPTDLLSITGANNHSTDRQQFSIGQTSSYNIGRDSVDGLLYFSGTQSGATGYNFLGGNSATSSTSFLKIATNGNVGIGSSTPGSLLSVSGNGFFGGNLTATGTLTVLSTANPGVTIGTGAGGGILQIGDGTLSKSSGQPFTFNSGISTNQSRVTTGGSFQYNGVNVIIASTTLSDYFSLDAGNLTMTGTNNIGTGISALASNTTGGSNVAMGFQALTANTSGGDNVAMGFQALSVNTSSGNDVGIGFRAGMNSTGGNTTAIGTAALQQVTTGANNTAVGSNAGINGGTPLQTISNDTFFGVNTNSSVDGVTNSTAIGNAAQVTQSNEVVLGNTSVTRTLLNGNVGIGTTTPASALDVKGDITDENVKACSGASGGLGTTATGTVFCEVSFSDARLKSGVTSLDGNQALGLIDSLNPVSFYWKDPSIPGTNSTQEQFGFIAQQVNQVAPNLVGTTTPTYLTPDQTYYLNYQGIIPLLAKAIQAQQGEIIVASSSISTLASGQHSLDASASTTAVTLVSLSTQTQSLSVALASTSGSLSAQIAILSSTTSALASSTATTLASSTPFIQAVANAVLALIQSSGQLISSAATWTVGAVHAVAAVFTNVQTESLQTQTAAVTNGLEMTDSSTGQVYCVRITNGDWQKGLGSCSSPAVVSSPIYSSASPSSSSAPSSPVAPSFVPSTTIITTTIQDNQNQIISSTSSSATSSALTTSNSSLPLAPAPVSASVAVASTTPIVPALPAPATSTPVAVVSAPASVSPTPSVPSAPAAPSPSPDVSQNPPASQTSDTSADASTPPPAE